MGRARKIGITEGQRAALLHVEDLDETARARLAYDLREILGKELEDLEFLFSEAAFKGLRYRQYFFPLEAILPQDPRRTALALEQLRRWRSSIELIEKAIVELGIQYLRK